MLGSEYEILRNSPEADVVGSKRPLYALLLPLAVGLFAASATKFAGDGWLPPDARPVTQARHAIWQEHLFAAMVRNSEPSMSFI